MHLAAGQLVGRIVAANMVPDAVASPELEAKLAKDREPETLLTTEQHQELLMKLLEENGSLGKLDGWKKETALKAKRLLMEFHHIFSLERNEIGCTDTTKHIIELLPEQDEPFKREIQKNSATRSGRGTATHSGNAGWRCYMAFSVTLV